MTNWDPATHILGPLFVGSQEVSTSVSVITDVGLHRSLTVFPPLTQGGVARVFAPNGSEISTTGTTTSGLQEAFTYAHTNLLDVHVYGNPAVYLVVDAAVTLNVPVLEESSHWVIDCSILFNGSGSQACLQFDSALSSIFELNGRLMTARSGKIAVIKPTTATASAAQTVFSATKLYLGELAGTPDGTAACTHSLFFDGTNGSITRNFIEGNEWNGGATAIVGMGNGAAGSFSENFIRCPFVHGQSAAAWGIAATAMSARNLWEVNISGSSTDKGLTTAGSNDILLGSILVNAGASAITFETAAAANLLVLSQISGTLTNSATVQSNQIIRPQTRVNTDITVTASPQVIQNLDAEEIDILVSQGGTITTIGLGVDGITYHNTNVQSGLFRLKPGMFLKITYTGAPSFIRKYT